MDTIRWLHNGAEVPEHQLTRESDGLALSLEDLTVSLSPFILFLSVYPHTLQVEDGGEYSCIVTSGSSVLTQTVSLQIFSKIHYIADMKLT